MANVFCRAWRALFGGHVTSVDTLGYGVRCPLCTRPMDEGEQTGVYWRGRSLCTDCAPRVSQQRADARALYRRIQAMRKTT